VFYNSQNYTKTPEEAAAAAILAGNSLFVLRFLGKLILLLSTRVKSEFGHTSLDISHFFLFINIRVS